MGYRAQCSLAEVYLVKTNKYILRSLFVSFGRSGDILVPGTYLLFFFKEVFSCLGCAEILNPFVSEEQEF